MTFRNFPTLLAGLAVCFATITSADELSVPDIPMMPDDCALAPYSVQVAISGVRDSIGLMTADVYVDDEEQFLKEGRVGRGQVPAVAETTTLCIPLDGPGQYTVAVYHDENANKKFDKTWIGLPDEPFGLSRNPRIGLSAPSFEETYVDVNGPMTEVDITLKRL